MFYAPCVQPHSAEKTLSDPGAIYFYVLVIVFAGNGGRMPPLRAVFGRGEKGSRQFCLFDQKTLDANLCPASDRCQNGIMNQSASRDELPTASIASLKSRALLLRQLRDFFDERDFFEVETPLLSSDTVVDRHLHPIHIDRKQITGSGKASKAEPVVFLQTSPEFAMKRLLAGGADAVYQICKAFRAGEAGSRHNPEFTMLEWYRAGDDMQQAISLLEQLVQSVLHTKTPIRISYRTAVIEATGLDPFTASLDQLAKLSRLECELDRDEHLNVILSQYVEPRLGVEAPEVLYHYPASQAALAKTKFEEGAEVAERFEIYYRGVELANGYHELLDADELATRNEKTNRQRVADGQPALPVDSRLLTAMQNGLPACAGVALGVDRLLMLSLQQDNIESVIAFPFDRA